jgi:hypothetical protein
MVMVVYVGGREEPEEWFPLWLSILRLMSLLLVIRRIPLLLVSRYTVVIIIPSLPSLLILAMIM